MATRIVPNPMFLAAAAGLQKTAQALGCDAILEEARRIAPRDEGFYASLLQTDGESVGSTDFKAHWIEWGTVDTPKRAVIRRAVELAGLRLSEDPPQ